MDLYATDNSYTAYSILIRDTKDIIFGGQTPPGVHSYNKTSNDGKKVFSKWGYRKTAISVGKAK